MVRARMRRSSAVAAASVGLSAALVVQPWWSWPLATSTSSSHETHLVGRTTSWRHPGSGQGSVIDTAGRPVVGARMQALAGPTPSWFRPWWLASATTDTEGDFVPVPIVGSAPRYRLTTADHVEDDLTYYRPMAPWHPDGLGAWPDDVDQQSVIVWAPARAPSAATRDRVVRGTVVRAGHPVADAVVILRPRHNHGCETQQLWTRTNADGAFALRGLAGDFPLSLVFDLHAVVPGSALFGAVEIATDGRPVEGVEIAIGPGHLVTGVVVDSQGRPVAGVQVGSGGLRRAGDHWYDGRGDRQIRRSDRAGRFSFVATRAGAARLQVVDDVRELSPPPGQLFPRIDVESPDGVTDEVRVVVAEGRDGVRPDEARDRPSQSARGPLVQPRSSARQPTEATLPSTVAREVTVRPLDLTTRQPPEHVVLCRASYADGELGSITFLGPPSGTHTARLAERLVVARCTADPFHDGEEIYVSEPAAIDVAAVGPQQVIDLGLAPVDRGAVDLGATFEMVAEGARVTAVADEVASAGIRVGDRVTAVDGVSLAGHSVAVSTELAVRVAPGRSVTWSVQRGGVPLTLRLTAPALRP